MKKKSKSKDIQTGYEKYLEAVIPAKGCVQSLGDIQTPASAIFIIFLYVNNCTLKKVLK